MANPATQSLPKAWSKDGGSIEVGGAGGSCGGGGGGRGGSWWSMLVATVEVVKEEEERNKLNYSIVLDHQP